MAPRPTIAPEDVAAWTDLVPTLSSPAENWAGVAVQGWITRDNEADMPPIRDHLLVLHASGPFELERELESRATTAVLQAGSVSLLTREAPARWRWEGAIEFANISVTQAELARTGEQMFGRDLSDLELADTLDAADPQLTRVLTALRTEAGAGGEGSRLLVESLTSELGVHLLRRHAHLRFREMDGPGALTFRQERGVRAFVRENLSRNISLDELADVASLSRYHFARVFRSTLGMSPHEYLVQQRLDHARTRLRRTAMPISHIAAECGFADQSHLTRVFRRRVGVTPARYRTSGVF